MFVKYLPFQNYQRCIRCDCTHPNIRAGNPELTKGPNLAVWDPSAPPVHTPPSPQEIAGSYPAAARCVGRVVVKILGRGGAGGGRQRTGPV